MDTTLVEALAIVLLVGIARLWLGGLVRLWAIAPDRVHHPLHAARRQPRLH